MTPIPGPSERNERPTGHGLDEIFAVLLEILLDVDQAEETCDELEQIVDLLDQLEGFEKILTEAIQDDHQREEFVRRVFHGRISEPTEILLKILVGSGKLPLLRGATERFRKMVDQRSGRVKVTVTTAVPLDRTRQKELKDTLREIVGSRPRVYTRVDESILGGMIVRIGDKVYDASIAAALSGFEKSLSHRIASRGRSPARQE